MTLSRAQMEAEAATLLVARAQAGDRAAFAELVRRYRPRIFALSLHLTGSESDADDVAQEVFISAFRNLKEFEGRSEFFTWVYRMAVNRSLNSRRDTQRRNLAAADPRLDRAIRVDSQGDPVKAAELRQTYALLLGALDALPAELRTTVVLVALQGLNHAETAIIQSCSEGTISWRMHEARKRLRKALDSHETRLRGLAVRDSEIRISSELSQLLEFQALATA